MSFPRYPKYKDSGVAWLGEVPTHWSLPPLYLRYELLLGKMLDTKRRTGANSLPYLRNVDVQWDRVNTTELPEMDIAPWELQRFTLKAGDVLVCEGGEVGRTAMWRGELDRCAFQKAIHRLRPLSASEHTRFLYYCMRFASATNVFIADGNQNTIPHLTGESFRLYRFPCPPVREQIAIAAFLDRETEKIDALVAEQRLLMDLLAEKRQAVISHAVTRGLNPAAPMKASGTEWIGELPSHWDVSRIANVFREVADAGTNDRPILSVSIHHGVSDKEMDEEEMDRRVTRSDDRSKYKQVDPDDLVYNMMRAWQGAFGTVTVSGQVSPAYVVARPHGRIVTEYVEHLLRTPHAVEQMRRHSRGVTDFRLRLYWDEFKNIRLPIPPQPEAIRICSAIDEMDARFDALTAACEESVALLQERRTALISAAVTGQIDVRSLPAE